MSRPGRPAKLGDLVIAKVTSSAVFLRGGRRERVSYVLGIVTSVTRDGWVKAYRTASGDVRKAAGGAHFVDTMIGRAADLSIPPTEALEKAVALLGDADLETLEEVRAVVFPWAREGKVRPWPNGIGWDVDGHHVVVEPDGTLVAALVGLPEGAKGRESAIARRPAVEGDPTPEVLRALVRAAYEAGSAGAQVLPRTAEE